MHPITASLMGALNPSTCQCLDAHFSLDRLAQRIKFRKIELADGLNKENAGETTSWGERISVSGSDDLESHRMIEDVARLWLTEDRQDRSIQRSSISESYIII